jgi:uncharacterized membrane protein
MLSMVYFAEGVVRAASDTGFSAKLAIIEIVLSVGWFVCCILYARATRGTSSRAVLETVKQKGVS